MFWHHKDAKTHPQPRELFEAIVCERFGWTPDQLDSTDAERLDGMLIALHEWDYQRRKR